MSNRKYPATQTQRYRLWAYNLWSDGEGGMVVNDRYRQQIVTIRARHTVHNEGTEHEFVSYVPTDRQLNHAVGSRGLSWDGEPAYTLYASDRRGNPACELVREID